MTSASEPSTAEHVIDTSGSSVRIVAPVVDLTGEATASSDGYPSQAFLPVVSVRSSSGRGRAKALRPLRSRTRSLRRAPPLAQHSRSRRPTTKRRQRRACRQPLPLKRFASQRLAYLRAKKRSGRSSKASSIYMI